MLDEIKKTFNYLVSIKQKKERSTEMYVKELGVQSGVLIFPLLYHDP